MFSFFSFCSNLKICFFFLQLIKKFSLGFTNVDKKFKNYQTCFTKNQITNVKITTVFKLIKMLKKLRFYHAEKTEIFSKNMKNSQKIRGRGRAHCGKLPLLVQKFFCLHFLLFVDNVSCLFTFSSCLFTLVDFWTETPILSQCVSEV